VVVVYVIIHMKSANPIGKLQLLISSTKNGFAICTTDGKIIQEYLSIEAASKGLIRYMKDGLSIWNVDEKGQAQWISGPFNTVEQRDEFLASHPLPRTHLENCFKATDPWA